MTGRDWATVLAVLMLITTGVFVFSFVLYLRKYKIIQTLLSKINKSSQVHASLRREQLQRKIESRTDVELPKLTFVEKIYLTIKQLGILEVLPGFNEIHVLAIYLFLLGIFSVIVAQNTIIFGGFIFFGLALFATKILCSVIIAQKREKIEEQLSLFINACEGASTIHSDLIDIIGEIYERTRPPLNRYLEECYLEAKIKNNKQLALRHLKEKTNSIQFQSIIDNLQICSNATGDYQKTIEDIREPVRITQTFRRKKQAIVKNARASILLMTGAGLIIVFISMAFLDGASDALLHKPLGNILLAIAILIMLFGITIKTKE